MNPFVDISVQPSYGKQSALVRWSVTPGHETGDFYIYKSLDGTSAWELLNPDTPVVGGNFFEDTNLVLSDRTITPYYRILLEVNKKEFDSEIVGALSKLNRKEYGIVRKIMGLEVLRMREGRNGVPIKIFKPLTKGKLVKAVDKDTEQSRGLSLDKEGYGQKYKGGYAKAIDSFMEKMQISESVTINTQGGSGSNGPQSVTGRVLVYPQLQRDDLIVQPDTDERYLVDVVKYDYFRGIIPVTCVATLIKLQRGDIRYSLPIDHGC